MAVSTSPAVAVETLRATIATGVIIEMTRPIRATGTRRNTSGVTATCTPDIDSPIRKEYHRTSYQGCLSGVDNNQHASCE